MNDQLASMSPEARRQMLARLMRDKHRARFQTLSGKTYPNYGAMGLLPSEVIKAVNTYQETTARYGPFTMDHMSMQAETLVAMRADLGRLLHTQPEQIALTGNTTTGCNIVLWGLPWQEGDRISVSAAEYPGVLATIHQLQKRYGIEIDTWEIPDSEPELLDRFRASITARTRLALVSHVLWDRPRILPIGPMRETLPDHCALLVDGAQSVGVLPVDLNRLKPHFYAFTGHKWCCAPEGAGALAFAEGTDRLVQPTWCGPMGMRFNAQGFAGLAEDATRFQSGTLPVAVYAGWRAALELHDTQGDQATRRKRILEQTSALKKRLAQMDRLQLIDPHHDGAGLVFVRTHEQDQLVRRLEAEGILIRTIPETNCIRISTHYFTTEDDHDRLLGILAQH